MPSKHPSGSTQYSTASVKTRPASASRPKSASAALRGEVPQSLVKDRSPLPRATQEPSSTLLKAAHGATQAAAAAVQLLWDNRDTIPRPTLPDVQPLMSRMSTWLPSYEGSSTELRPKRPGAAASLEAEEAALQRILEQQASASEAIQLLRARAAARSLPGQRTDSFKFGLVVEGGGMRGAVSGGALQALHDLGLRDCFDVVYGSSAGAINATYFLSGQREGVDIYSQDITNSNFIDLKRLLRDKKSHDYRPALDLSYLLDYVMDEVKPLDWQAVVDSPIPLKIVASCLDRLQPVLLEKFIDPQDLKECLRASAAVPEVAGDPILHRGRRLVDAAVFEAIPFRAAIADGCTHILALPTRPPYKRNDLVGKLIDDTVATIVKKAVLSPSYMQKAWIREVQYQRAFGCTPEDLLVKALQPQSHKLPGMAGCHVFPVFPGPAASYSPLCIDAATIMLGIADGRAAINKVLGVPTPYPVPTAIAKMPTANTKTLVQRPAPAIATTMSH